MLEYHVLETWGTFIVVLLPFLVGFYCCVLISVLTLVEIVVSGFKTIEFCSQNVKNVLEHTERALTVPE